MTTLSEEISVFESLRSDLEAKHQGKCVLIRGSQLVGVYGDFEAAAAEAVRRFGSGPYLIREVGAPDVTLPASVVYAVYEDA